MSGHVRYARLRRFLIAGSLVALAGVTPLPAAASTTGAENINLVLPTGIEVSGSVLGPNNEVAAESDAGLCDLDGNCFVTDAVADETGAYVIGRVEPGSYKVMATGQGFLSVWLGPNDTSVTDFSQAITIDVTGDMTLPTLHLAAGFSISGTLTDPQDNGVADAEVVVNGNSGGVTMTDANGHYTMGGLAAGFYSIDVLPPLGSPFQGGTISSAGTIEKQDYNPWVEVNGDETGIDATLAVGRSISGTITGLTGPADVNVSGTPFGRAVPVADDGTFVAGGLWADEPQTLVVTVRTPANSEDGQFPYGVYDGTSNLNPDQNAVVEIDVSGGDVTGLTLAAPHPPKISGTVLDDLDAPVAGFLVLCSDDLGCGGTTLAGDGSYAFINLPDSSYWMYLRGDASGYVTASGGLSQDANDRATIVVTGSDQVVNIVVPVGLTISGRITGPDGEPIEGANPSASLETGQLVGGALTDANGEYVIKGLLPGDYFVHVSGPEGGNYFGGYWSESGYTTDFDQADLIHVPSEGVAVVSTNPTDGASGVIRTIQPSVTFSGSVDVSAAVVSLKGGHVPVAMRGTVSYDDATHTLTFEPRGRLVGRTTYVFQVSGLTASGVPIDPVSVTFTTGR